jgi:hypothetical protein
VWQYDPFCRVSHDHLMFILTKTVHLLGTITAHANIIMHGMDDFKTLLLNRLEIV